MHDDTGLLQKKRVWIYAFLFTLTLINYIDRVSLSVASKVLKEEFNISPVAMGYLFSSFVWLYFIALIPMGYLVGRYGPKKVNGYGIGVWSVATACTALSTGFISLLSCRLIMGAGEATTYPAGARVIREWMPLRERGMATAVFHSGSLVGPAVGAIGFGWLITAFGWRIAFLVAAALGFVWLAAWLKWYSHPSKAPWLSAEEREEISGHGASSQAQSAAIPALGLSGLARSWTMWAIALSHGCAVYATYFFLTWLPSYLQAEKGLTVMSSGIYTAIPYIGAAVLAIVIGRLSDRVVRPEMAESGQRRVVVASVLLASSVIFLVPALENTWAILMVITLSLATCASAVSLNLSLVNDLVRAEDDVGTAAGFITAVGNLFGLLAPIVTGYVVAGTGRFAPAFVMVGVLLVVGAMLSMFCTRRPVGAIQPGAVALG
ncbi:MFS transporter [Pseudomonas poae]|uniref:MFS transporter n=1 Tax=Pseudomonas poae TaxID=200451 RepID=A0A2S9EJD8_9PSED|nr:MFS transporter [Pseudomonas poae]PRA26211.1 MFS transporter [Pseudomonas poae]PRC15376.1 MFS transporter [Pseudomonas poae]